MAVGQFLNITNYRQFEIVYRQILEQTDLDPALVYETALPGFLQNLYDDVGAWPSREQKAFEFPSKLAGGKVLGANERARRGGYDKKQIVAQPGLEIGGETQTVRPVDFMYGGMSQAEVTRRAMRPRLDWNKSAFTIGINVATQGGYSGGTPVEEFAFTALDNGGNTVTKSLVTESADVSADVIANSTQSILWPKRDGTEFTAGHDHNIATVAGGVWTLALARTHRDLILEHPGMGITVDCYVGVTVAEAIRAVLKSEYGAVIPRIEDAIKLNIPGGGGLGAATMVAMNLEGVDYWYSPDMPATQALYVAKGKKPFYFSQGAVGVNGEQVGTGAWFEPGNVETRGGDYGYRQYLNAGVQNPIAATIVKYV